MGLPCWTSVVSCASWATRWRSCRRGSRSGCTSSATGGHSRASSWAPSSGRSSPDSLWRGSPGCRGCSSAECTSPAHRTDSMKQALEKLLRNNHAWADGVRNEDPQFFERLSELQAPKRSEEHTSELQSLLRTSYAVFCVQKKKHKTTQHT